NQSQGADFGAVLSRVQYDLQVVIARLHGILDGPNRRVARDCNRWRPRQRTARRIGARWVAVRRRAGCARYRYERADVEPRSIHLTGLDPLARLNRLRRLYRAQQGREARFDVLLELLRCL